ncbi:radical SAM protein [Pseudomonas fluorescens]|uniref:radical SAM protein n=1 Tax=Pseudomonas TaxID=286 RepID=UPI000F02682C|nr:MULTISPECIES: SPASM domain-containing protein [Pseudomonas]MBD8089243.1 radical SAM protein [Pseudomonas fluorescens]MBD8615330.1 radical SAM protein [Pseudomonas putida]MBD8682016.1 radical SAM protein [Pseudomonas sp. CFBP 13719]
MTELTFFPNPNLHVFPEQRAWTDAISSVDISQMNSIEQGYFVFTMMPSLRCSLNCPHCYLTLDQRRNSPIMTLADLEVVLHKVDDYYAAKRPGKPKVVVFYWYGGEPTEMGFPWFLGAFKLIDSIFTREKGYEIRHDILTSLLNVEDEWLKVFHTYGRGQFQTSFDGLMRGKGYVKKWDKRVRQATADGLRVSTISVVNHELFKDGPVAILDYLTDLGIQEASFLPFMLNEQNKGDKYEKFAPPMSEYSNFMIELTEHWIALMHAGKKPPMIGQLAFILSRQKLPMEANIAGQTLFLLPDGDFVLPDYKDGWLEFMKPFGNILEQTFEQVLTSKERRGYIRRQYTRNLNPECVTCNRKNNCIMEFWKENRPGDDCFGAKRYVDWLMKNEQIKYLVDDSLIMAS